ncbi:MAG: tetratricopeptide repeat protein [Pseudomonadota bacterium]
MNVANQDQAVDTGAHPRSSRFSLLAILAFLVACQVPENEPIQVRTLPVESRPAQAVEPDPVDEARQERHRRRIADWLYEGLRAMREDRLMTPPDKSAHAWFSRVLALEPDNALAMEGLRDIVARYVELAELAARQGQFDNAERFLERAGRVQPDHPGIEAGRQRVQLERERTHSVYTLDVSMVARRDRDGVTDRLREPLRLLSDRPDSLYLLITAPDDEQGRWIYGVLREQLEVRRLPGDIEIGGQPSVRLVNRG